MSSSWRSLPFIKSNPRLLPIITSWLTIQKVCRKISKKKKKQYKMQGMKEKIQDMGSTVKEKIKEGTANVQGKAEQATARTHGEKEAAKERERAREAKAKAELHGEKAEHREEAGLHHGVGHVPLTGPHHHRPAGMGATKPTYPTTGTHPTTDKYL